MSGNIPSTRPAIFGRPETSHVNSMRYTIELGVVVTTSRSRGIETGSTKPARIARREASSSTSRNCRVLADSRISHQTPAADADLTATSALRMVKSPCFPCQNSAMPRECPVIPDRAPRTRCQRRRPPAISHRHRVTNPDPPNASAHPRLPLSVSPESPERLSIPFLVVHPDIDESPLEGETPDTLVSRLSEQKARAVGARVGTGLVIGSDQNRSARRHGARQTWQPREQRRSACDGQRAMA